jgi:Ca2+-binding EF-hand superfamily protein
MNRNSFPALLCSSAMALAVTSNSQAQSAPTFESLDANSDGKISVHEASSNDALFVAFKNLDKDRDGSLTREEFAAYKPRG